jgi:hypothetical protein
MTWDKENFSSPQFAMRKCVITKFCCVISIVYDNNGMMELDFSGNEKDMLSLCHTSFEGYAFTMME